MIQPTIENVIGICVVIWFVSEGIARIISAWKERGERQDDD